MTAPTLLDLLYIKRNYLSRDQCNVIINEFEASPSRAHREHCPQAFTNTDTYSTYKFKESQMGTDSFSLIHSTIENIINEYHDYLDTFNAFHVERRGSMLHPHKYRIMKYEEGTWIHPHIDHTPGIYGSCTLNLNEEYEGGDFAFWGGRHKVKLGVGDVMIWPADFFWVHEVEEITKGIRYSANTFLCRHPFELPEEVKYNVRQVKEQPFWKAIKDRR
tara:strand:- start:869 stop:1522 length:654 start_codon:yes stop_codon:yes gene_type:complete